MHGTEEAAAVWQDTWTDHVKEKGILAPAQRFLLGVVFLLVAARRELAKFLVHMSRKFEIRRTGRIGYDEGCATKMKILKPTVRLNSHLGESELEADPRHAKDLLQMFNMEKCMPGATPRQRLDDKEVEGITAIPLLDW